MRFLPKISAKVVKDHPYTWLWESLEGDPEFLLKSMFGGRALYLDGKLMLFFTAKEERWNWKGILVCTDRARHEALIKDFPMLSPHTVLPKWLYLPEKEEKFETLASQLVALAAKRDPRMGVQPSPKKKRSVPDVYKASGA